MVDSLKERFRDQLKLHKEKEKQWKKASAEKLRGSLNTNLLSPKVHTFLNEDILPSSQAVSHTPDINLAEQKYVRMLDILQDNEPLSQQFSRKQIQENIAVEICENSNSWYAGIIIGDPILECRVSWV